MHMEMTFEEFKKLLIEDRNTICQHIDAYTAEAEKYQGDKKTSAWRNYEMHADSQRAFCEELNRAVSLPLLAPEVLGTRYRLWNEFVESVKALGGAKAEMPSQEVPPRVAPKDSEHAPIEASVEDEENELTVYKDKHPQIPPVDDLVVLEDVPTVTPASLAPRIKPKPKFHTEVAKGTVPEELKKKEQKPLRVTQQQSVPTAGKSARVTDMKRVSPVSNKNIRPAPKQQKPIVQTSPKPSTPTPEKQPQAVSAPVDVTLDKDAALVRKQIIEKVAKTAKGFLDNIFGSMGDNDAGLTHIKDLRLADIIEIEKLVPDAHTARLAELGVTQKEWGSWIDWVNESNRVVAANVDSTLTQYVDKVSQVIAKKET